MGPAGIVKLQRNESNSRFSRFSDACCFLSCSSMLFLQILSRWDIPFLNYHPVYFVNLAARRLAPQWFWMTRLFMGLQVEFVSHVPLDKAVPGLTFDTGVVFVWSPADNDHQDRSVVMCFLSPNDFTSILSNLYSKEFLWKNVWTCPQFRFVSVHVLEERVLSGATGETTSRGSIYAQLLEFCRKASFSMFFQALVVATLL